MQSRRQFLTGAVSLAATGLATPALALGDLELHLVRQRTGEIFRGSLVRQRLFDHKLDRAALTALNGFLRDLRSGRSTEMDLNLIRLVGRIQRRIGDRPVVITSAYRTHSTNAALQGSAKNSFHMRGQALDIHVRGLLSRRLRQLARDEDAGGVGWYPSRGFVHIDTGPRRDWRR
ncbi:DUF882 domain-containing protein [Marivita sp.]|uniref:YcbK family protein n=1 Tax=Marivita sp. TaxID=2003365 RepID=UPI00321B3DDC